jgi:hypothetical protein
MERTAGPIDLMIDLANAGVDSQIMDLWRSLFVNELFFKFDLQSSSPNSRERLRQMYKLGIKPNMCLSDAEVEALRGTEPKLGDEDLIEEATYVFERAGGKERTLACLVRNCLDKKLVVESAKLLRTVHGDLSNRGSIIHKGSMMSRKRKDGSLSFTKVVPPSVLQFLRERNARLGLTGPYSDFLGYADKTPRHPFCRETNWSLERPDIFEISRPLVQEVDYVYRDLLFDPWKRQRDFMKAVSGSFKYTGSTFSTVTINLNVSACYHTDEGDFRGGMGNLVVLELGRDDSGILVVPREHLAFIVRPRDVLLMNVHHMHGNCPLTVGGTRLTAVLYARERINDCGE